MKTTIVLTAASAIVLFTACLVPFDYTTERRTIVLENASGAYTEQEIEIPEGALSSGLHFDKITLHYTVKKADTFEADLRLYISADEEADNVKGASDELTAEAHLALPETEKSGSAGSDLLKDILNDRKPKFVIGAENLSGSPVSAITIEVQVEIKGSYSGL